MKKYIYSAMIIAAAAIAVPAEAQQRVNLNKGDQNVESVKLGEGDYIAFGRPAGVGNQRLAEILDASATKNSVTYTILTKGDGQMAAHMVVNKWYLEAFMREYMNSDLYNCTEEELFNAFSTLLMAGYGSGMIGEQTYNLTNGEKDVAGSTQYILGGQDYYIVTCDLVQNGEGYALGTDMSYKVVSTAEPDESDESLEVTYDGLDDAGKVTFSVTPGDGIKTLHMVLGTKKSIDELLNVKGYDYIMATEATDFTASSWNEFQAQGENKWNVSAENHYSFLVLGVDANGDQVKRQIDDIYIKPVSNDNCPKLNTDSFSVVNRALYAHYSFASKTSAPITKATLLLMSENDWDNALNDLQGTQGYENPSDAWPVLMASDKATDVTSQLQDGTFTYTKTFTSAERDWYVLVFAVTDANGTSITRTAFHSQIENAEPTTLSHTYPVASAAKAAAATPAKGMKVANGKVRVKASQSLRIVK